MKKMYQERLAGRLAKRIFLLLCLVGISAASWAQQRITGQVTETSGAPIYGASVVLKNNPSVGASTDNNGNFAINVPANATLVVSFVGFNTKEVPVAGRTSVVVILEEDSEIIDEVVVVGYGTQRKSDVTGSVTQVKPGDLAAVTTINPLEALQGRAAGVAVFSSNVPGAEPVMRIRGSGSITANNTPLFVVDGFPLMSGNLNDINTADIASMEILKDASATAIYGSRGANGVVLITTKSGSAGRSNLSVTASVGIQTPEGLIDQLEASEFVGYINEQYTFRGGKAPFAAGFVPTANTNWQKEILKSSALVQNYAVSMDGANERTSYMLSFGYYDQDGLVAGTDFNRLTLHNNLNHKFNKWITIGSHIQLSYSERNDAMGGNVMSGIFQRGWPTMPLYNADGSYFISSQDAFYGTYIEGDFNPVLESQTKTNSSKPLRVLGDIYAEFQLAKNLKFRTNWGMDIRDNRGYNYTTSEAPSNVKKGTGNGGNNYSRGISRITENQLSYNNQWGQHRFSAVGVYSYQDYTNESLSNSIAGFQNDQTGAWDESQGDKGTISYSSTKNSNKLVSVTARVTYSFKDRYLLTATGRYDGSSRFGENNKYGFFPSLGLGWRIDQENFMKNVHAISALKIRASYGVTGNQEIGNYQSLPRLTAANYIYNDVILKGYTETIGNSDLKWERTKQFDLGFDLSFWNRLHINFDYYNRITSDLLYSVPIPTTSGFSSILSNVGEVKNNGVELTVGGRVIDRAFKLDASVNMSHNKNEISKLYGNVNQIPSFTSQSGIGRFLTVGYPVNSVWGRESAGIIRTQDQLTDYTSRVTSESSHLGAEMYKNHSNPNADPSGDKIINADDFICFGSVEPKLIYGLTVNMSYKNFTLDIFGQGAYDYASVLGGQADQWSESSGAFSYGNISGYSMWGDNQMINRYLNCSKEAYAKMWSETNPNGSLPRVGAKNVYASDRTNAHWNYFILKNIQLSYQFKAGMLKDMRVYINAQNYVSFSNHAGYNPENGDDSYPWSKIMTFGINARF